MDKTMRLHAKSIHPTHKKLERLIKFLQDEQLEISFYFDRIFVKNTETPMEKEWEIVNSYGDFVSELPTTAKYKLGRDVEYDAPRKRSFSMLPKNMEYEPMEDTSA